VGCKDGLPGWPPDQKPYDLKGNSAVYPLPTQCAAYLELASVSTPYKEVTNTLNSFMKASIDGGSNLKAIIIMAQISYRPANEYDVYMALLVEIDHLNRLHNSRRFIMRDKRYDDGIFRADVVRGMMGCMTAAVSWWMVSQSDVINASSQRLIYVILVLVAESQVSNRVLAIDRRKSYRFSY